MGRRTFRRVLAGVVGVGLVVGACGDDDDESGGGTVAVSDTEAPVIEPEGAPIDEPEDEPEDTEPPATDPPTNDDPPASGPAPSGDGDASSWCAVLDESDEAEMIFAGLSTLDPPDVEDSLARLSEILPLVTDAAPAAIEADAQIVVAQAQTIIDAFAAADYVFLDVDLAAFDQTLQQEADAAQAALDDFSETECGRPFGDPSADDPPPDGGGLDPGAGTIREQAVEILLTVGFTSDEANCIVENIDINDPNAFSDPATLQVLSDSCGITEERFAQFGG